VFVVTVSDSPPRVLVEDVRSRRKAVAEELGTVGSVIARLLDDPRPPSGEPRERSVSAET